MTKKEIQYAAHYPFAADDDERNTIYGPTERSDAEGMVRFVNKRLKSIGRPQIAELVERTVTYSEWTPANTGIVPPFIGERE